MLRRDWRERRADLIVRTGDQAEPKVSRQMAPFCMLGLEIKEWRVYVQFGY